MRKYVANDEMFLANYSDGLIDMDLPEMIRRFRESGKIASFVASPRYDLNLWIADLFEGATYLPR